MTILFRRIFPLLAALLGTAFATAQEVRQLNRIATPAAAAAPLPPGARAAAQVVPVAQGQVQAAVERIVAAWNTPKLAQQLAANFYDATRLVDALATKVPRDAVLRVLAIEGAQTTSQYLQTAAGGAKLRVSRVVVTVRTQVEYNDPSKGFQRLDGTNEFVLLITEAAS